MASPSPSADEPPPPSRGARALEALGELGRDLLALVWPTECVGCGAPDRDLCRSCLDLMRAPSRVREEQLGLRLDPWRYALRDPGRSRAPAAPAPAAQAPATSHTPPTYLSVPLYGAGPYEGVLRAVLVAQKHQGRLGFSRVLGAYMHESLHAALTHAEGSERPLIVCVPSRRARVRERGYRHVELVVRAALRSSDVARGTSSTRPASQRRVLRPLRGRTTQVGLTAAERERNARRIALRRLHRRSVRGREVVVVDDVVTTGATITAACEALAAAGAEVVAAVALCVVERRDTREPEKSAAK